MQSEEAGQTGSALRQMKRMLTFLCVFPPESGRYNMQDLAATCRKNYMCMTVSGGGVAGEEMFLGPLRMMG